MNEAYVIDFEQLSMADLARVGGKNASLGEMISRLAPAGIRVPTGFATTAAAYREFLAQDGLAQRIADRLDTLDAADVAALAMAGTQIRHWIEETPLQPALEAAIREGYASLLARSGATSVAVRSSATAEDLPGASFAGQQETYLNVIGIDEVLLAVRRVFASLYNDRAISYRVHRGFKHADVALSAGIQQMVRADQAVSGVMFTLDTESGFRDVVLITSSYGLGELIVQGAVNPDEFYVHKPMLRAGRHAVIARKLGTKLDRMIYAAPGETPPVRTVAVPPEQRARFSLEDAEVETLAGHAMTIEAHYGCPMDIEWGKDGGDGKLYILQARPETIKSEESGRELTRYYLKSRSAVLVSGRAIGQKIGAGTVRVVAHSAEMESVRPGEVLVTDMTDPDWEPVMKRASAIVTNRGGRTCHAAIVARELGIPAVVGTADATQRLHDGQPVTVSCAEGDTGVVYDGVLEGEIERIALDAMPKLPVKIMLNVGNPERAFDFQGVPNAGVGLARLEFIIARMIGVHPKAILELDLQPAALKTEILERAGGYRDPREFYVAKLTEGIATIAAAFWPKPVIVRLSDFKSNEYAGLLGGTRYEPKEENPMLGLRGAARYVAPDFRDCFELECESLRRVRHDNGLNNVEIMVPFVRTVEEARAVSALLDDNGLKRGTQGLRHIMMCEIPANVLLAEAFLEFFDGFSIGSNDLTQLTLGIDRDSGLVAGAFDERNPAVKRLLAEVIATCKKLNKYVGICGQGPSDHPDFAQWLMEQGIDTISLNPDAAVATWLSLAEKVNSAQ